MPPKKQRGAVEESKESEVENVREANDGSPNSANNGLVGPPEILKMIFEHLINNNIGIDLAQHKKVLLDCRLAHPEWRIWMDDVLGKGCLEMWKKSNFSMEVLRSDHLFNFSHLPVLTPPPGNNLMMTSVMVPPVVQDSANFEVNPFLSNSLRVSSCSSEPAVYANLNQPYKLMGLVSFFTDYGHHLTSLVLFSVNLAPETLQGILRGSQNLQAMTLDTVRIAINFREKPWQQVKHKKYVVKYWVSTSLLPPLPNLKHVRIFNTDTVEKITEPGLFDPSLFVWIMTPYQDQLVTFDGDDNDSSSWWQVDFPLLKKLSIWKFKFRNGKSLDLCGGLEYIFLGEFQLGLTAELGWIQWLISHFMENLIQLHLDVVRNNKAGNVLNYSNDELQNHYPMRWSARKLVFSKLTTFSVLFPKFEKEVETVKDMLSCMPHLETLNLFRFREDWEEGQEASPEEIASVRDHVEQKEYWVVCPRLKKISVRLEVSDSSIFFTKRVSP